MEKRVYEGNYISVTEEDIQGHVYERAYFRDSLYIFPVTDAGGILFILESRPHETPTERWKPVTGFYENEFGLEENVNRELQEEVGYRAECIEPFFQIEMTGTLNLRHHFVLAKSLVESKLPNPDGEDSILEIRELNLTDVLERTLSGEFGKGVAGYALLKLHHDVSSGKVRL